MDLLSLSGYQSLGKDLNKLANKTRASTDVLRPHFTKGSGPGDVVLTFDGPLDGSPIPAELPRRSPSSNSPLADLLPPLPSYLNEETPFKVLTCKMKPPVPTLSTEEPVIPPPVSLALSALALPHTLLCRLLRVSPARSPIAQAIRATPLYAFYARHGLLLRRLLLRAGRRVTKGFLLGSAVKLVFVLLPSLLRGGVSGLATLFRWRTVLAVARYGLLLGWVLGAFEAGMITSTHWTAATESHRHSRATPRTAQAAEEQATAAGAEGTSGAPLSPTGTHAHARWPRALRAAVAGAVAGLGIYFAPAGDRAGLATFLLVRAAEAAARWACAEGFLPAVPYVERLVFGVAGAHLIGAWLLAPWSIDPAYARFLDSHSAGKAGVLHAVANVNLGSRVTPDATRGMTLYGYPRLPVAGGRTLQQMAAGEGDWQAPGGRDVAERAVLGACEKATAAASGMWNTLRKAFGLGDSHSASCAHEHARGVLNGADALVHSVRAPVGAAASAAGMAGAVLPLPPRATLPSAVHAHAHAHGASSPLPPSLLSPSVLQLLNNWMKKEKLRPVTIPELADRQALLCYMLHPLHDNCFTGHTAQALAIWRAAVKTYLPVYTLPALVFRPKQAVTQPLSWFARILGGAARSSLFYTALVYGAFIVACAFRHVIMNSRTVATYSPNYASYRYAYPSQAPPLFTRAHGWREYLADLAVRAALSPLLVPLLGGLSGALALGIEKPGRRMELALYLAAQSLKSVLAIAHRLRWLPSAQALAPGMFIISTSVFLATYVCQPHHLRPAYFSLLQFLFGSSARHLHFPRSRTAVAEANEWLREVGMYPAPKSTARAGARKDVQEEDAAAPSYFSSTSTRAPESAPARARSAVYAAGAAGGLPPHPRSLSPSAAAAAAAAGSGAASPPRQGLARSLSGALSPLAIELDPRYNQARPPLPHTHAHAHSSGGAHAQGLGVDQAGLRSSASQSFLRLAVSGESDTHGSEAPCSGRRSSTPAEAEAKVEDPGNHNFFSRLRRSASSVFGLDKYLTVEERESGAVAVADGRTDFDGGSGNSGYGYRSTPW